MTSIRKFALGAAALALLGSAVTPAIAADLGVNFDKHYSVQDSDGGLQSASDYRRRGRYHRDRVDAGDVIAGIGILAGIAIIASAANKSKQDRRRTSGERYPENYPQPRDQDTRPYNPSGPTDNNYSAGNDLGAAVDACSRAAEQSAGSNARVKEIRSVTREGDGWQVLGNLNGSARGFSCVASNGNVSSLRLDDGRDI
jgi:hypothetical protein